MVCRTNVNQGRRRPASTTVLLLVFLLENASGYLRAGPFLLQEEVLTNESVIELAKAGLSESLIISKIRKSKTAFKHTTADIIRLKKEGVSDQVIAAMIDSGEVAASSTLAAVQPPAPSASGAVPPLAIGPVVLPVASQSHPTGQRQASLPEEVAGIDQENGVYYKKDGKFIPIFGKPIAATNTGGFLKRGLTMGISKIRMRGQLPGKHAQLQVTDRDPVFYFCMPEGQPPENFTIVEMEKKDDRRQFEVGSAGGFSGSRSSGLDIAKVYQILIERIAPRIYRVRPDRELDDGEYGFVGSFTYASVGVAGAGEKVYDFGVPKLRKK